MPESNMPADIAHIIQLAVAPVFLLAGIGALLKVMAERLGRVVDRWRVIERELSSNTLDETATAMRLSELAVVDRRMASSHWAIALSTLAALLICLVIILLFTGQLLRVPVGQAVAVVFIISMCVLTGGLVAFLIEIGVASRRLRVARTILEEAKTANATPWRRFGAE